MVSAQYQTPAPRIHNVPNSTNDTAEAVSNVTSKLGNILGYPSRLLHRMRSGLDELLYQEDQAALAYAASHAEVDAPKSRYASVVLPGPWGFLTSGYVVGLFAMALILNRIQNIVVPPRHPLAYRAHRNRQPYVGRGSMDSLTVLRVMYSSIFPVDLSSTFCRLVLRIPSLYFLAKALALWCIILLQTAELFPSWQWNWLQAIGNWAATKEMQEVCWFTFTAICGGLCVGALTRGLEGQGSPNSSPFNLFGYAFLLHIYSSPLTHTKSVSGLPSRPDAHVVITIILPLLQVPFFGYDHWCVLKAFQVVMIHALGIKQRWSRQRLIPTTICSVLTLVHFHSVLWLSEKPYPLLNYLPCVLESILASITLLTVMLNAVTQLLLEGAVTRPLFGHAAALLPRWDEDFSVALLRLGTASLEATSVAGLGNEVGGVNAADGSVLLKQAQPHTEYGEVELNRFGVASVSHTVEAKGRRRRQKEGLTNEIRNVRTGAGQDDLWWDAAWYKEFAKFAMTIWKICRGFGRWVWNILRMKPTPLFEWGPAPPEFGEAYREEGEEEGGDERGAEDAYERFIRDEVVSDDEEDYRPPSAARTDSMASDDNGFDSEEDEPASETAKLYADLSESSASRTGADAPVLLAHMTNTTPSPLTRRKYSRLVRPSSGRALSEDVDYIDVVARERRRAAMGSGREPSADEESRRNCVICTVEPRQIICWPCRCLALCDDCRENLASRSSASKHTCPCCRRLVEGYSRIFVP